jgi:hypothetical protein
MRVMHKAGCLAPWRSFRVLGVAPLLYAVSYFYPETGPYTDEGTNSKLVTCTVEYEHSA